MSARPLLPALLVVLALLPACAARRGEREAAHHRLVLYNATPMTLRVWIGVDGPGPGALPLVLDGPWTLPARSVATAPLAQYGGYLERQRRAGGRSVPACSWWAEVPEGSGPLAGVYEVRTRVVGEGWPLGAGASLLAGDRSWLRTDQFSRLVQVRADAEGLPTAPRGTVHVEPAPEYRMDGAPPPAAASPGERP